MTALCNDVIKGFCVYSLWHIFFPFYHLLFCCLLCHVKHFGQPQVVLNALFKLVKRKKERKNQTDIMALSSVLFLTLARCCLVDRTWPAPVLSGGGGGEYKLDTGQTFLMLYLSTIFCINVCLGFLLAVKLSERFQYLLGQKMKKVLLEVQWCTLTRKTHAHRMLNVYMLCIWTGF